MIIVMNGDRNLLMHLLMHMVDGYMYRIWYTNLFNYRHMNLIVNGHMFDDRNVFNNRITLHMMMMNMIGMHVVWHVDYNVFIAWD